MKITFTTATGTIFESNDSYTYFYATWTNAEGKTTKKRIKKAEFEQAQREHELEISMKMDEAMDRKVEEAQSKKEAMERSMNRMDGEVDTITQEDLDNAAEDPTVTLEQFTDMLAEAELAQAIAEFEESCINEEKAEILKEMEEEADRQTEDTFNGTTKEETPKEAKPKKARKPRRSKDSKEFEVDGQKISLTPKQIDFIQHLPDTCFWENGLDSCIWVDCLCDDIGGQFADKPMTVGAMISTLCEKGLGDRVAERRDGKKCTSFELTETGKAIAEMLGVH